MSIREQMTSAVENADIDLSRLTTVARTQGTRAIRRRRAASVGAVVAVALTIGVGATSLVSQDQQGNTANSGPGLAAQPAGAPDMSVTVPATGPGAAAALRYAVQDNTDGSSMGYFSQGPYGDEFNLTGGFAFTSASTGVTSYMQVHITTSNDIPTGSLCTFMTRRCEQSNLPDGSVLVTSQTARASDPGALIRDATVWRPDGTSVSVSNSTGQDIPGSADWGRLSQTPSFTFQQLADIAQEPWWGSSLPATFVDEGDDLDVKVESNFD